MWRFSAGTAESRVQVVSVVRVAAGLGRATTVQTGERIRGLSAGRLPVHRQSVAEKQTQEEVQPQLEAPEGHHVLTVELSIRLGRLAVRTAARLVFIPSIPDCIIIYYAMYRLNHVTTSIRFLK